MVDRAFAEALWERGLAPDGLTPAREREIRALVSEFWAAPSLDPATPPPHSTGAAIDATLTDENGRAVDMGSPIDRNFPIALFPTIFPIATIPKRNGAIAIELCCWTSCDRPAFGDTPRSGGIFSFGDQLYAWLTREEGGDRPGEKFRQRDAVARYGRYETPDLR